MDEKEFNHIISDLDYVAEQGYLNNGIAEKFAKKIVNKPRKLEDKKTLYDKLIAYIGQNQDFLKTIFIYSIFVDDYFEDVCDQNAAFRKVIDICMENAELSFQNLHFVHEYVKLKIFRSMTLNNYKNHLLLSKIDKKCFGLFMNENKEKLDTGVDNAGGDLYVVITTQFLSDLHAPTHITCEWCYILMQYFHKRVLLINTAELISIKGYLPLHGMMAANYLSEYNELSKFRYKNIDIPFLQCDNIQILNADYMVMLIRTILNLKPYRIIDMGGDSLVASILNRYVPSLAVPMGVTYPGYSMATWELFYGNFTKYDYQFMEETHFSVQNIIQTKVTFNAKNVEIEKINLSVKKDRFNIIIVGTRLDADIDENFLEFISGFDQEKFNFVFCGRYDNYESDVIQNEKLKNCCEYIGFQKALYSVYNEMDLYLNPERAGGGISSLMALTVGVPVVTLKQGDVYYNCGDEFAVDDYDSMRNLIEHYREDSAFYQKMSAEAIKYIEELPDQREAIGYYLKKIES